MNTKPSKADRLAAFIERHKVALAVTATAVITTAVVVKVNAMATDDSLTAALDVIEKNGLQDQYIQYFEEH